MNKEKIKFEKLMEKLWLSYKKYCIDNSDKEPEKFNIHPDNYMLLMNNLSKSFVLYYDPLKDNLTVFGILVCKDVTLDVDSIVCVGRVREMSKIKRVTHRLIILHPGVKHSRFDLPGCFNKEKSVLNYSTKRSKDNVSVYITDNGCVFINLIKPYKIKARVDIEVVEYE